MTATDRARFFAGVAHPTRAEIEAYELELILADVLEAVSTVDEVWADTVGTHYAGCWVRHAQCLAQHVRSLIEDGDQ